MRWLAGMVLALLPALHGGATLADSGAPQISPLRRQREDAQRLREHQRGLDRERPPEPVVSPPPPRPVDSGQRTARTIGVALLFTAGISGALALTMYATDSTNPSEDGGTGMYDGVKTSLAVGATVVGVVGLGLVLANRPVQVAPTVTPTAVGFVIAGRL